MKSWEVKGGTAWLVLGLYTTVVFLLGGLIL